MMLLDFGLEILKCQYQCLYLKVEAETDERSTFCPAVAVRTSFFHRGIRGTLSSSIPNRALSPKGTVLL